MKLRRIAGSKVSTLFGTPFKEPPIAGHRIRYGDYVTLLNAFVFGVSERIQLAQDIWDSVAEIPESLALADDEKAEIDRRLNAVPQRP